MSSFFWGGLLLLVCMVLTKRKKTTVLLLFVAALFLSLLRVGCCWGETFTSLRQNVALKKSSSFTSKNHDESAADTGALVGFFNDVEDESDCMRDAFFSIFTHVVYDHHHRRRENADDDDIFCENLVKNAKDADELKCRVATRAVSCRLERSKVKSRLGNAKCFGKKKRFGIDFGCERCALKQIGSDDDGDGVDTNNNNNNNNNNDKRQQQRQKRGLFKFLFYDDQDEDDDDDDNADDMEEEEEEDVEDETRHFFSVTKETELHMYFTALSRVETECMQHEQRFRALRASRELSEFFKRIELSEMEAKASVEKSMEKLRAMEFEIKSSMHETLLETQNVHNQTSERLNLTLMKVQEAQNAVDKLNAFAKVHAFRLKELANTFNRVRDALSKSSLVFFFFVWWFVFGTSFVPHAMRAFLRECVRHILGAILFSQAIEIALVPRLAEYYYQHATTNTEIAEEDIDIELLIAQLTRVVRTIVATTIITRSMRIAIRKNNREKSRLLEQEALAKCLRRVETDVRTLLEAQRRREEELEEEEEEEKEEGRRCGMRLNRLLPSGRKERNGEEEEETPSSRRASKRLVLLHEETIDAFEEEKEEATPKKTPPTSLPTSPPRSVGRAAKKRKKGSSVRSRW